MFLSIIDELGNYEKIIGNLNNESLSKLLFLAKKLNLKCITYISEESDTIFNQLQIREISKEIEILSKNNGDNEILTALEKAIAFGLLEDYLYLKLEFNPDVEKMRNIFQA